MADNLTFEVVNTERFHESPGWAVASTGARCPAQHPLLLPTPPHLTSLISFNTHHLYSPAPSHVLPNPSAVPVSSLIIHHDSSSNNIELFPLGQPTGRSKDDCFLTCSPRGIPGGSQLTHSAQGWLTDRSREQRNSAGQ